MALPTDIHPFVQFAGAGGDLGTPIGQSLRFQSANSTQLTKTLGTATDRDRWTFSVWVKKVKFDESTRQVLLSGYGASNDNDWCDVGYETDNGLYYTTNGYTANTNSIAKYRDPAAWQHVVVTWDGSNMKFYSNGRRVINDTQVSGNLGINGPFTHTIGNTGNGSQRINCYMAEMNFLDGILIGETLSSGDYIIDDFGRYNIDGEWVPQNYSGTYGSNGFHLTFDSSQANGIGHDSSGSGNHFTASGFDTAVARVYSKDLYSMTTGSGNWSTTTDKNWSSFTPPTGFNGNTGDAVQVGTGDTWVWRPSYSLTATLVEVNPTNASPNQKLYFNGTEAGGTYTANGWNTIYTGSATTVNHIGGEYTGGGNGFYAIRINGTILVDNFDNDVDYVDTPTSNVATLNPLIPLPSSLTHSEGNLRNTDSNGLQPNPDPSTHILTGKKYWEVEYISLSGYPYIGICKLPIGPTPNGGTWWSTNNNISFFNGSGYSQWQSNPTNTIGTAVAGDIIGVAFDNDTRQCTFTRNGGTGQTVTAPAYDGDYAAVIANALSYSCRVNFGQRSFTYTPPTGYTGLVTNNDAEPAIKNPSEHFQVLSNNGSNILSDAQAAFPTALYLIKGDASSQKWYWIDPMNGTSAAHRTPLPTSTSAYVPYSSGTSYAYIWNCPDSFSATGITNGYRNETAGFSMVQYTGDDTNPRSIPHGLGKTPGWIILWNPQANDVVTWITGLSGTGTSTNNLILNTNEANNNTFGAGTLHAPTDTDNFIVGNSAGGSGVTGVNQNAIGYTAFIWAPIDGYSAMGTYTGDGNTDGRFQYCGFKPKWVLIKSQSADPWGVYDTVRDPGNPCDRILRLEDTGSETDFGGNVDIDIVSNGFKVRGNNGSMNGGANYQWVAFAESPFGGENTAPATAR